jgi:hypothetical protein
MNANAAAEGQSRGRVMFKSFYATLLAAGFATCVAAALIAAPMLTPSASAQTSTSNATTKRKPPSDAVAAMRERQKKCGAEWKAAKAAGKIEKGMKWPQYWSACNKRLKGGA